MFRPLLPGHRLPTTNTNAAVKIGVSDVSQLPVSSDSDEYHHCTTTPSSSSSLHRIHGTNFSGVYNSHCGGQSEMKT
ncbi:hypothetical protein L1987_80576 [Smallanthus sonchifolius]|uniref:Uncharacterized protein n=1 Tax=Smallanthus sonchifolius TaxID=185202 RepID=A0ACB8YME6_9ASTR|nr:hypothetical protein L1987_80576 [Smallanthus sonchifolius]